MFNSDSENRNRNSQSSFQTLLFEIVSRVCSKTKITYNVIFQEVQYVRALYDHVSPEPALLNFKKGDVIKIVHKDDLEEGWVYGIFNNHGGYFPADFVTHIQEVPRSIFFL